MIILRSVRQHLCYGCGAFIKLRNKKLVNHVRPMFETYDGGLIYGSLATKEFMEKYFPDGIWVGGGICGA